MALTTFAHAQAPGGPPGAMRPGGPGAPGLPGGPGGVGQSGGGSGEHVTNVGTFGESNAFDSSFSSTTTTTTTEDSTLPNTGGEPLLMVLGGLALAGGAFAVRRKLA